MQQASLYIPLIHKKLLKRIESEELDLLEKWLQASVENQQLAKQIEQHWADTGSYQLDAIDLSMDWETPPKTEIADEKLEDGDISTNPFPNWVYALAMISLVMCIGYFLMHQRLSPPAMLVMTDTNLNGGAFQLPDGSQIWLNKGSELRFPSYFDGKIRQVSLSGQAYLEIQHDAKRPFIVETGSKQVEVLGTKFDVKDYAADTMAQVRVVEGKVAVRPKTSPFSLILNKDEASTYNKTKQQLDHAEAISPNSTAWHTARFVFEDTPLDEVITQLRESFRIQIELENLAIIDCPFSFGLQTKDPKEILEVIVDVYGMDWRKLQMNIIS